MDSSATLRFSDRHQFVADFWLTHLLSETNANVRITLATGQKFVFAHTAALILASEYIQTILTSSESNEDGIFDISLPDFTFEVAQSFLKLLYTGSADTHVEEMKEICSMFGVNVTTTKKVGDDEGNTSADDDAGPLPPTPVTLNSEEDSSSDEEKSDDEVALTVKLEENLTKAKLQDNRRRKSSTTTIAQQQQKEAALQPKNKRVLMADMDQTELTCGVCGKEFHILYKLKLHKLIHSSSPPFVCSMCGKGFNNKYKMRVHEKNHVSVGSSAVGEGNKKKRKKKEEAEIEIEKDEDDANRERPKKDPLTCEYCDASQFQTKAALNEHIGAAHPNFKRFLCCTCGKGFRGQKGLDHHKSFVCERNEKAYPCSVCSAKFCSPRDVKRHLATHGPKQEWKCPQCPTVCSSRKSLKIHGRVAHMDGGAEALPHQCLNCGKTFLKLSYLEEHQNRFHMAVKQFGCMFCPKRCSTRQDLDRHLASHRGEAAFSCSHCPRTFVHRANFKAHQRSHAGEKPYRCIPCDKGFGLLNVLRKHQKSHQRKGDRTQIVTAPKGRRGCMSYIDFGGPAVPLTTPFTTLATATATPTTSVISVSEPVTTMHVRPRPQAYIPSAQYIASATSGVSQMQVIGGDYGEITAYNVINAPTPTPAAGTGRGSAGQSSGTTTYNTIYGSGQSNTSHNYPVQEQQQPQISLYHHNQQHSSNAASYQIVSDSPTVSVVGQVSTAPNALTAVLLQPPQPQQQIVIQSAGGEEMNETESIAMDIMGLFNEPTAAQETETTHIDNL